MRRSWTIFAFWGAVIAILLGVEVAELTRLFTLPIQSVVGDPIALVTALVFTTILAVVGAIFIGLYISHRLLTPTGFTPYEQEMLRMRTEVREIRASVEEIRRAVRPDAPARPPRERT
ncbi:MAG TPA: hypothetical protein VLX64_01825 [Thermoplasmata archaeon]|nr:hypothetical protein [Thermoplasmata archaeon]